MKKLQELKTKAKAFYSKRDTAHNWSHIERLIKLCKEIGKAENASMNLLLPATIFHGMKNKPKDVKRILENSGFNNKAILKIFSIVKNSSEKPRTKEERVLYDANLLDSLGAIGLARAYTIGGFLKQDLKLTTKIINKNVKRKLLTNYGKKLALNKKKLMIEFFKQIKKEM